MRKTVKIARISSAGKIEILSSPGKFRRLGRTGLVIGLAMILLASPALASKFPDIKDHWGQSYIQWGVNEGLVVGYEDGTFQPNKSLSEAEFATMLTRFTSNSSEGAKGNHWSDPFYSAMGNFKLPFKGYQNMEVRNQPVDRGTIAQIVASKNGFDLPLALAIQYMYDNELSQGLDANVQNFDTYGADKSLTRAEAVTFLERLDSIGATSFMGIPSPTTDGRKVLTDAERDKIRAEVAGKVNDWLVNNKDKLPQDQLKDIESWLNDKTNNNDNTMKDLIDLNKQDGLPSMSMEMMLNPLVQKAMSEMGSYDQAKTNTYYKLTGKDIEFSAIEIVNHAVNYMNYRYNYDGKNMVAWNNGLLSQFGVEVKNPANLEGKKVSSENYAGLENLRAMGDHWLIDVINFEKNNQRVGIFTVEVGTRKGDGNLLYAKSVKSQEVK